MDGIANHDVAETTFAASAVSSSHSYAMGSTIPLLLALGALAPNAAAGASAEAVQEAHASSATNDSGVISYFVSDAELMQAINGIVDGLISTQVELDPEAKGALYRNRWELYD